jgi:ATP-binding cassette subfamily B multidrug efflux pump
MVLLIWPIIAVGWVVNLFQRGTASVKRIDELLRAEPAIDDSAADPSIPAGRRAARRDRIPRSELQLRRDAQVLRDISLTFPPAPAWPSSAPPARANPRWST